MSEPDTPSLETQRRVIDKMIRQISRRYRLSGAEAEDLASDVMLKLVQHWNRICGDFRGRASFEAYLYTIIDRAIQDRCNKLWGKWRASATAQSIGPDAVRLEALIHRQGLTVEAAIQTLRLDPQVAKSARELETIADLLPPRSSRRPGSLDEGPGPAAAPELDPCTQREDEALATRIETLLARSIAALPDGDRLVLILHFFHGVTIADLSRVIQVPQKKLYKRMEAVARSLRRTLESQGIDRRHVDRVVGRAEFGIGMGRKMAQISATQRLPPGMRAADSSKEV